MTKIRIRRREWLGHVTRMEDTRIPKMLINTKPGGRHGVGRPKMIWLDDVEADIKTLGIKIWKLNARDRKERMVILRGAMTKLKGL
jgi:hypothetical protein